MLSRAVAQINYLDFRARTLSNPAVSSCCYSCDRAVGLPNGRGQRAVTPALTTTTPATLARGSTVSQEAEQDSSLRLILFVRSDPFLVYFLRLCDDNVSVATATLGVRPGAEVPRAAKGGREVLVRKISGVLEVAEGTGTGVHHFLLGTSEELLHLRVL